MYPVNGAKVQGREHWGPGSSDTEIAFHYQKLQRPKTGLTLKVITLDLR